MAPMLQKKGRPQIVQAVHIAAPVGGINTIAPASEMPDGDCIYLYNMIGSQFGLRSRLGFAEWVTGLGGEVRTTLPFSGSHKNGSTNKLFGCSHLGILDGTTSGTSPSQPISFGVTTGDAGYGISTVAATPGGRFLLYCDEENGLYVYAESNSTWTKVASGTTQVWQLSTFYEIGNHAVNGGNVYVVTAVTGDQLSASSGGPTGAGVGITDGNVTWAYVSAAPAHAIGPSLADQQNGFDANPANFAFVCIWKSRVWFVEKDTSRAWYGDVNAIFGTFTSFDFGQKMQHGGPLVGLYNWSYDGGNGMDTLLVGISGAGDIVIYQGTDPTQASSFGLQGVWFAGGVVSGRRIATDYGGDLLVLSLLGVLPLSKLVIGNPIVDRSQYLTAKVANLFNSLASTYGTLPGWSLHVHPTDNALLITVPQASGQPTIQLAYSFATKGWSQYRDLPMLSAGVWDGTLYFGTTDGRLCLNEGYADNVLLSDPNASTPVTWSLLTAYANLGNGRNKQIRMLRPTVLSQQADPIVQATAKYGFDMNEPIAPSGTAIGLSGTWDNAIWDAAQWAGDYVPAQPLSGSLGLGRDVAIAIQGRASARTTLVGVDVHFEQGGLL